MLNGMNFLMTFTFDVVQVRPEARSSEFISGRLFNATLYLDGRAKVESFIGRIPLLQPVTRGGKMCFG